MKKFRLSLRVQLALVSLLMLLLPWAGCQSIKEMERVLRDGQTQALKASMNAAGAIISRQSTLIPDSPVKWGEPLVATLTRQPMIVDGYDDEWYQEEFPWRTFRGIHQGKEVKLLLRVMTNMDQLYLFFRIYDPVTLYYDPLEPERRYNKIWLYGIDKHQQFNRWQLRTQSEGAFTMERTDEQGNLINHEGSGFWSERDWGYQIELKMPLNWARNGLGFRFFSAADGNDPEPLLLTTGLSAHSAPVALMLPNPPLDELLQEFTPEGVNLTLLDEKGWQLGSANKGRSRSKRSDPPGYWLMEKLYNLLLERSELPQWLPPMEGHHWQAPLEWEALPTAQWFRDKLLSRQLQLYPITLDDGRKLILAGSQGSERLLSQAGSAFDRLLLVSLLVMLIAGAGLLGYATLLSVRIRKLSRQAELSVSDDGQPLQSFTPSHRQDEIGELSRIIARLLARQKQYTEYLQTLSSKLSHELRTPLAVVRTSLDNLSMEQIEPAGKAYLQRALDGSNRLSQILSSLSMASRLEQAMGQAEMERLDLAKLLQDLLPAYQAIYPHHQLSLNIEENKDYNTLCAPDLIVQLLDKLVDNAADFTPEKGVIRFSLQDAKEQLQLSLFNSGSQLPEKMASQLFDSLVSVRTEQSEKHHLGLGLHIVRLIAQHHGGTIAAHNLNDGVEFTLTLPKQDLPK